MTTARNRKGGRLRDERAERGIPEATVARLPIYLRALTALADRDVATASSEDLASAAGVNSAKLRKDCLLYTSPSPRDGLLSRMPSSA